MNGRRDSHQRFVSHRAEFKKRLGVELVAVESLTFERIHLWPDNDPKSKQERSRDLNFKKGLFYLHFLFLVCGTGWTAFEAMECREQTCSASSYVGR